MENWMITMAIFLFVFGGPAVWGVIHSILEHRKEMAELKLKHAAENRLLSNENAELQETINHMKDRLAVLETIATDPATRTAAEIEKLR